MSVRILSGDEGAFLFDTDRKTAIGEIFDSAEDARDFLDFLGGNNDPRKMGEDVLAVHRKAWLQHGQPKIKDFRRAVESAIGCYACSPERLKAAHEVINEWGRRNA